jgi:hypothetical protein
MPRQHAADDLALHPSPAPVDESHFEESAGVGRLEVVGDDGRNIGGGEGVEIEGVLDRDRNGLGLVYSFNPPPTCCCQCW